MPGIDIQRSHDLGLERARKVVDRIAAAMTHKFGIDSAWEGDILRIKRAGMKGEIEIAADSVRVRAQLGLMLGAFKSRIEDEIRHQLDEHFG
ncbi:MAG: polyhydroxyalkanoic acid system family protein [Pseudomonadota bacterium]|nr:polyhydroxyalkanoic acid system family protein [Pseudomonadota bacterium]